jgi:magnesium chelatase subunit I
MASAPTQSSSPLPFPFSAIVGQEEMKLALLAASVDASIGGVLIIGDRGTGKSTGVRALAALLPPMRVVDGCPYRCAPDRVAHLCSACETRKSEARKSGRAAKTATRRVAAPKSHLADVAVVDLPLGATEDRVAGALDLERALAEGVKAFEPGLLARANRGFLYIDEVNLLEDHLVDLLLDVAASGENIVEREGISVRHPARFVLVGSGNPEEGELRPQLLDRFGLAVEVRTPADLESRVEVVRRRDEFDRDPAAFRSRWEPAEAELRRRILAGRQLLPKVRTPDLALQRAASLCMKLGTDGLRGELTLIRAARAVAALEGDAQLGDAHLLRVATIALRHRLRRDPLDESGSTARIERAVAEIFGS